MNSGEQQSLSDIRVDRNNLYREEVFTDLQVASIRRLTPIKPDGSPDGSRRTIFVAQTHLMSQIGPLPVQSEIEADTLEDAMEKFPEAIQQAVEEMMEEAKERRRQETSRIVVPGTGLGGPAGLAGPGGIPPGGNIRLG